jgi:hypothetical protein
MGIVVNTEYVAPLLLLFVIDPAIRVETLGPLLRGKLDNVLPALPWVLALHRSKEVVKGTAR